MSLISTRSILLDSTFNDFLSLKTDANVPTDSNEQNKLKEKLIFCWHLESH
jgi:hypothetical protein